MVVQWYEWRNIRSRLLSFGRAVQGVSPYRIELEPDRSKCPTGFTSYSRRLIRVNPTMFEVSPEDQYDLTKAVLCHEAGHRRFTTPSELAPHVHMVSNILEDERIERLMESEFAGVRGLMKRLSSQLLADVRHLDPDDEHPAQLLNYILQLRWTMRSGESVIGSLSDVNLERWSSIEHLVLESWCAETSAVCDRNAAEIVRILGIREPDVPQWLRDLMEQFEGAEGARGSKDPAETATPSADPVPDMGGTDGEAFDGERLPLADGVGPEDHRIYPKPYMELEAAVRPLVDRLVEELSIEPSPSLPEPSERGGRLSVRQALRDPDNPFLASQDERPGPPTVALRVVVDHSTSMNMDGRIEYAAQAAMLLHLAAVELEIDHQIVVTPHDIRIADLESGETGLARIAGIIPAMTGFEDTGLAVATHGKELIARQEDVKLLLVVHDGMGNDYELLTEQCERLRERVLVLGVGIGMGETEAGLLKEQFGPDRYIHCDSSEELPLKVGAVLRAVRGV